METYIEDIPEKINSLPKELNYSFSDLVNIVDLQELMTHFSKLVGLPVGILDVDNTILATAGWQKICNCFHRVHPETNKNCFESDCSIRQNMKTKEPYAYKCKNGLWDVAYPIIIENKHVANIFFGQFFFEEDEVNEEYFELQAEKYGFDKAEYINALKEVPRISKEKADSLKHYNAVLAKMLTLSGYSNLLLKKEKIEELKTFNELLKKLVQKTYDLNATKDKFFSIIAHDLRNPFAVLISASKLLLTYLERNDVEKAETKARMIEGTSKHAYTLLENLLEWSRSQSGVIKFNPAVINLRFFSMQCLGEVEELAINKNITLMNDISDGIDIVADEHMLCLIARNLITNAIKYTHEGGTVAVSARKTEGETEISVTDTGVGIDKEHLDKLFRLDTNFSKLGTANERGSSLGLILCKEFVDKHKGRIWVESELGKGSKFLFTLPDVIEGRKLIFN